MEQTKVKEQKFFPILFFIAWGWWRINGKFYGKYIENWLFMGKILGRKFAVLYLVCLLEGYSIRLREFLGTEIGSELRGFPVPWKPMKIAHTQSQRFGFPVLSKCGVPHVVNGGWKNSAKYISWIY